MRLTLVLTHACDLACRYCYAGEKFRREMPVEVGERALRRALLGVPPGGTLALGLFGGEPLLAWDLARTLVGRARALADARGVALEVDLTSNGTHLTPALLDEALALGVRITISMDGLPEVHDAWRPRRGGEGSAAAALRALALLVARGEPARVVSVVRPETLDRVVAGARLLVRRGVGSITHSLDWSAPWRPEHAAPLRAAVRGLRRLWVERAPTLELSWLETKALLLGGAARPRCGAGQGELAVAPSGRVYPCERLVGDDAPGEHCLGHLDDAEGPLALPGLACQPGPGSACDGCAAAGLCANDCACANLARGGAPDRPDGLVCALEQACLEEAALAVRALAGAGPRRRALPVLEVARG